MVIKKLLVLSSLFFLLSSCTCGVPMKVTPIQRSDKKLACKDIILEINEAEHYRAQASKEKGIGMGESLMPVCWVSGYVDGSSAIKRANDRIDYLGHIYDLMDCGGANRKGASTPPPPKPIVVPIPPKPTPPPPAPMPTPPPRNPGDTYYKLKNNLGPDQMHEHKDRRGRLYIHSHPHNGPHRHLEDQ